VLSASLWIDSEEVVDGCMLQYSLDDGQNWTDISNASIYDSYWNWYTGHPAAALGTNGWSGQSDGWIQVRHLLPDAVAGQDNVQFRYVFMNDKVNNEFDGVATDDIRIMEAPMDLDLLEVLGPLNSCELSTQENFRLRMRNVGLEALQAGDSLEIAYRIDRSGEIQTGSEIYILGQGWPIGGTLDLDMESTFDFSNSGIYESTVLLATEDPHFYSPVSNDTLIRVIEVNKPAVELGEDISTVQPDTVLLKAYSGVGGQTYIWQDGSSDSVFQVATTGTYHVLVLNAMGCIARDTIQVLQLVADVGVSAYLGPASGCELADPMPLQVRVEIWEPIRPKLATS
jgi:hypothetical protein